MIRITLTATVFAFVLLAGNMTAMADDQNTSNQGTVASFIQYCQSASGRDACADLIAEVIMDTGPSCVPNRDLVVAELSAHPEWANLNWEKAVEAADANICSRPR